MRTSTAAANNYICPQCGDALTQDTAGRGFVRHKTNPDCQYENGLKDPPRQQPWRGRQARTNQDRG
jgi:ssDNA-binding Zn-finger/Zn-ribbon topoisomerase 1